MALEDDPPGGLFVWAEDGTLLKVVSFGARDGTRELSGLVMGVLSALERVEGIWIGVVGPGGTKLGIGGVNGLVGLTTEVTGQTVVVTGMTDVMTVVPSVLQLLAPGLQLVTVV